MKDFQQMTNEKKVFITQIKKFTNDLAQKIEYEGQWSIKGFIDVFKHVYTISSDTKVVSKILELCLFPYFKEFADKEGFYLELADKQNWYPDMTFIKKTDPSVKFAVDLKTTYRSENGNTCNGFTLGSHGEYFINRQSHKNVQYPYGEYCAHICLGIIYTRHERNTDETAIFGLADLKNISSVASDFKFFAEEKWKIASDKGGSGNTANIGSIHNIDALLSGRGTFIKAGEKIFDEYWMNYGKIPYEDKDGKIKKIKSLPAFLQFKNLPLDLYNPEK